MTRRARRLLRAVPVGFALALSGASVWASSDIAFSVEPDPAAVGGGPSVLQVEGSNSAAFDVGGLAPGGTGSRCLVVSAEASERGPVRLFLTSADVPGALAESLLLRVEVGTGGSLASCTGFSGATAAAGTLAGLLRAHHDFGTGIGGWTPRGGALGQTRTYRVTYTLDPAALSSVAGLTVEAKFVWERQPVSSR